MPLLAPVRKTFTCAAPAAAALALCPLGASFGDQEIERCGHLGVAADAIRRRDELAVDDDRGHRLNVVRLRLCDCALHLAVDAERRVYAGDLSAIEPLAGSPVEKRLVVPERLAIGVD